MLFNSIPFLIFLLVVIGFDQLTFRRLSNSSARAFFLLACSLFFYLWSGWVEFMILTLVLMFNGVGVVAFIKKEASSRWLVILIVLNLLVLFGFKYIGLAWSMLPQGVRLDSGYEKLSPLLPVGISFYVFQLISLLVDIQRDHEFARSLKSRKHLFLESVMYVSFFPQLVAGPIVKAKDFFWQIEESCTKKINWLLAFRFIIIGYFLKTVVADNLKDVTIYLTDEKTFSGLSSLDCLLLLFGYSIQIFADFAGYSVIAIGLGLLMGFQFPINFNLPYISTSFSEFWTRWHISLSSWLREYLYFSLGGNRKGGLNTYRNLLLVMLLGGLWHGAGWNYLLWGLGHGLFLVIERLLWKDPKKIVQAHLIIKTLQRFLVFSGASLLWLFFIYQDLAGIQAYFSKLAEYSLNFSKPLAYVVLIFSLPVILWHFKELFFPKEKSYYKNGLVNDHVTLNYGQSIVLGCLLSAILLNHGTAGAFIYFQF